MKPTMSRASVLLLASAFIAACSTAPSATPTNSPAQPAQTSQSAAPTVQATAALPAATSLPAATAVSAEPAAAPTVAATAPAAPAATVPALTRSLSLQQPALQGDDVRAVQQRLLDLGYSAVGEADGIFGAKSEAAVRAFQAINGLEADGIVGPQTHARLFSAEAARFELYPVVDVQRQWLLGATSGGRWIDSIAIGPLLEAGQPYELLTQSGEAAATTSGKPRAEEGPCSQTYFVNFAQTPAENQVLALDAPWNPLPRPVSLVQNTATYEPAVASVLSQNGLADPQVRITRALQADLEGDGVQEVVLAATYRASGEDFPSIGTEVGDYSLVLLLRDPPAGEQIIVASDIYTRAVEFGAPLEFGLPGIFDLNGDGAMELFISSAYYEGASSGVYTVNGGRVEEVLSNGCGV